MGVVSEFYKSDTLGLDVTTEDWAEMLDELVNFPDVILAVNQETAILYNKNYVKIKVVDEKKNGSVVDPNN